MSVRGAHGCAFQFAEYPTLRQVFFLKVYRQFSYRSRENSPKAKKFRNQYLEQSTVFPKTLQFDCILRQIDRQTKGIYTWQEKD